MRKLLINREIIYQILISLFVLVFAYADFGLKFNQLLLALVFIECCFVSSRARFFNIYQIFLLMMFFFNLSIPIFNLIGLYEYPAGNMFNYDAGIHVVISDETLSLTYAVLSIVLLGTSIGWLLNRDISSRDKLEERNFNSGNVTSIWIWIRRIFLILLPFEFIYQVILVRFSIESGYVATMHLHSYVGSVSSVFVYIDHIYPFVGILALYNCREKKEYFKYALLYLLPYIVQLFTGLRGNMISILMALLFVYSWKYRQIKLREAGMAFAVLFIVIIAIGATRFTRNINSVMQVFSGGLINTIIDELCSNGQSIAVLSYTIQLLDDFTNQVPFLLGYIFAIFSFSSNYSIEGILNKSYLAQHITYLLNPPKLLGGSTIGTSISAEFYEFSNGNMLVILLLSILMLYIANVFIQKMYKNPMIFYFAICYIQNLFLAPRGSVMKIFSKLSLAYILIYIVIITVFRKRGK